jgi:hypothetical protein
MSTKRAKTGDSEKLILAKAINGITKARDAFDKAVASYQELEAEALRDLDMRIDTKRQELVDAEADFEQKRKRAEVDFENFMTEHRRAGAIKTLEATNEVAIESVELERLRERVSDFEKNFVAKVEEARAEFQASARREKEAALHAMKLTHVAETAKLTAALEQKNAEIEVHKDSIERTRSDLEAQRELTARVTSNLAEASRNSHTIYAPPK